MLSSNGRIKSLNKSALPGVAITQFIEDIPKGYSLPDFERKPITVTLQEGKNAIFRAVVKGEPKPKVLWKCSNREMDDSQKYQVSFNPATNEFILQINKITSDDADLYHCIAVNEYGEATCTAGLKIIEDLKKEIQDFRKTLKKRTPSAVPKKKMDMEQIAQILLNAEKKDYEKICIKYGVVDFRGMLRKLQEMKKAREDKQDQYVYSIANLKHLKVNKEQRNASFDLEMELKNPESSICLYKDGQKINFGVNDNNLKHRLQQEGKNYNFTINDLQPDDAGIYQVKVEGVDIFSTELEAESKASRPKAPHGCAFKMLFSVCLLRSLVTHLESNYSYDISILNDGLIYHLGIKNIQSSDKETYTIDTGSCSSSTWLEIKCDSFLKCILIWIYKTCCVIFLKKNIFLKLVFLSLDYSEPLCYLHQGLFDVHAQKGKPTELSCCLNNDQVKGTWFKDGVKDSSLYPMKFYTHYFLKSNVASFQLCLHSVTYLVYPFSDPPNVDSILLEKLKKEPIVVKAGKNAMVKIPFEGQKPIRVMWLKDNQELLDDDGINIDSSENFTRLSIPSTSRKDTGDYKVRLKNECGSFEVPLKLEVIDKPHSPTGPIAVIDSSANGITIQWKPPRDDGGKPIQSYIIERQQVGRKTWVTLGKTSGSSTIFTTNKVEHDTSYYFRVKAVNSLGTSEALESDEVMAAAKASPSPPAPPKVNSASKDAITISWSAPHKIGNSRILGYRVEKRKKGSKFWTSVTDLPITDRKYTVNDLKEGLQYEFRVAAINNSGVGEASAPSEAIYARDPMKFPGPVKDLKVVNTDYCSISLSWMKPESAEESYIKGYIVEIRHSDTLKWTQCNTVPIKTTAYTFRGLKAREPYFVRVRAISDGGLGDPVEVDTCVQAVPSSVHPKFLVKDTVKSFMNVKAGDAIHVRIPFEASPSSEVIWLKDGLPLPVKATISIRERLSQLIIPEAELSDSGHYAISLQTEHGRKEIFSFRVQVQDVPESPGPIQLIEKVPGTVTLIWRPWQMVADHIYTNKCTVVNFISGQEYFFRVLAKNCVGISKPSETVNPWTIQREKDKPEMKLPRYKGINRDQPPRFLVQLKPHVVNLGFNCHMSCAVTGDPAPQVTWYKGNKNLSQDPAFFCKNDFGVCSLVIPGVTQSDAGQYKVLAVNELGQAISKAELTVKGGY
uniref:Immunoglobulin like and fibronectin type III domain containing 1, tandem duplicate 3 n=1 Tax=Naja naja TaxID=35670 RepID=A0A8C6YD82_NAJNA